MIPISKITLDDLFSQDDASSRLGKGSTGARFLFWVGRSYRAEFKAKSDCGEEVAGRPGQGAPATTQALNRVPCAYCGGAYLWDARRVGLLIRSQRTVSLSGDGGRS